MCGDAERIRREYNEENRPHGAHAFIAADYRSVYRALKKLQNRAATFLEWGSASGVITIMAGMLGFEAYGIELDPLLVEMSQDLADRYCPDATFAQGSFIPADFTWTAQAGDTAFRTSLDAAPAYDELDMELRDFDLVYAYPWPDEFDLVKDIMRQSGRSNALLLTFSGTEGMQLHRPGRSRSE